MSCHHTLDFIRVFVMRNTIEIELNFSLVCVNDVQRNFHVLKKYLSNTEIAQLMRAGVLAFLVRYVCGKIQSGLIFVDFCR